ncbi:hypothetical protein HGA88_01220 [Candidatus Roizmanbacteria bacterium]|nr:hypothetical protein [Candidatus Roizmanbacteria bacterium]
MSDLFYAIEWYGYVFILGLLISPLLFRFFHNFIDKGYALGKAIALLVVSYLVFLGGILHLVPFTRLSIAVICLVLAGLNYYALRKISPHREFVRQVQESFKCILVEELLFIAGFVFIILSRGYEPSVHGLEKFMDFGFMNSLLRSTYFPPMDMWLSADSTSPLGYPINYYYFGHLTGAVLMRLTATPPAIAYNLILATICGMSVSMVFSITVNFCHYASLFLRKEKTPSFIFLFLIGVLTAYLVNFGGNLHTLYIFTSGYNVDNPVPFWNILSGFHPEKYWYPNATRFIPYTIHEFPSYSYVVADLHGHVFDIPFVLISLALLLSFFLAVFSSPEIRKKRMVKIAKSLPKCMQKIIADPLWPFMLCFGFLAAIHYMTNAFDGPIYLGLILLTIFVFFRFSIRFVTFAVSLFATFILTALPFSLFFKPFVSGIGVNCSPDFLVKLEKLGPFLFEKGNCQLSAPWMLFILWGFFWIMFAILFAILFIESRSKKTNVHNPLDLLAIILYLYGLFLVIVPEFFYIKDIYPLHFRANTMFKLGYQSFIMSGIASGYTLYRLKFFSHRFRRVLQILAITPLFFVSIYPFFAFPNFYPYQKAPFSLDGTKWLSQSLPEDLELITYLNNQVKGQPIVLEAPGDSYTDYERISAYTGLPTIGGWQVHEWLWRGTSSVVGDRLADIATIYESSDFAQTRSLLKKYHVQYVVISALERTKYKNLNESKFIFMGTKIFESSNKIGALYKVEM